MNTKQSVGLVLIAAAFFILMTFMIEAMAGAFTLTVENVWAVEIIPWGAVIVGGALLLIGSRDHRRRL